MSELTRGRSGRTLLIAAALGLLVALTIVIPTSSASGDVPTTVTNDAGVILISTGPGDDDTWIGYYEDTGTEFDVSSPTAKQWIDLTRCNVSTSGDDILEITGTGGNTDVALISNGLGVKD